MTKKERFITALCGGIPDRIPTFELEFQLEDDMFGKQKFNYSELLKPENMAALSKAGRECLLGELAEHNAELYLEKLDYDSIPVCGPSCPRCDADIIDYIRILRKIVGERACINFHGDGTFSVPNGNDMYDFAYRTVDDFDGLLNEADRRATYAIEKNKKLADAGLDVFMLCDDYCYNTGPFLSPAMFSQLITPYLARIIEEIRSLGCYAIKHTDGNIMPIIDQLVAANRYCQEFFAN